MPGSLEYVASLETSPPESGAVYHVMAGGRKGRLPLHTRDGRWPASLPLRRDLVLVGANEQDDPVRPEARHRVSVADHGGLLLRVAGFPDGGVHGGHLAVIWNQGEAGYVLSMHFASVVRRPDTVLLSAAAAMSRSRPR